MNPKVRNVISDLNKANQIIKLLDWLAGGSTNDLVETFSTFHPTLVEICRYQKLFAPEQEVIPFFTNGQIEP